jgi:hypothetical protein
MGAKFSRKGPLVPAIARRPSNSKFKNLEKFLPAGADEAFNI